MVEEKGLDIVGIYRVPGNSAAVNALTEQVSVLASWKSINFKVWNICQVILFYFVVKNMSKFVSNFLNDSEVLHNSQ